MAKLPSRDDLGTLPPARTGKPIASYRTTVPDIATGTSIAASAVRAGGQAIGRGLQDVGSGFAQIEGDLDKEIARRDALSAIKAKAYYDKSMIEFKRSFDERTDYENFDADFTAGEGKIRSETIGMLPSGDMQERWTAQLDVDGAQHKDGILSTGLKIKKDREQADFLEALQTHSDILKDPKASTEDKATAQQSIDLALAAAENSNVISAADGVKLRESYVVKSKEDLAKSLLTIDPAGLQTRLDAGEFDDLDPVTLNELNVRAARETKLNDLLLKIAAGKADEQDLVNAQEEGWLTEYEDFRKVEIALDRQTKGNVAGRAASDLEDPLKVWDPTDAEDKKKVDALIESGKGSQRILEMDQEYVESGILPLIERTNMVPRDVKGAIEGMLRSSDPNKVKFALDTLDQMEQANPVAFQRDMNENAVKKLTRWREQLNFRKPEEIIEEMRRSEDPSLAAARKAAREEGFKIVRKDPASVDSVITDHFDQGMFYAEPAMPQAPLVSGALRQDYERLFAESYAETGDEDLAKDMTLKLIEKSWGVTEVNGARQLMHRPPEKYYPAIDGSHEWMQRQAIEDLRPVIGSSEFVLVADKQTEGEIAQGFRPSYLVLKKNSDGFYEAISNGQDASKLARIDFDVKAEAEAARIAKEQKRAGFAARHEAASKGQPLHGDEIPYEAPNLAFSP